jgi:NADH-quinone oxidoreductase subunit G
MAEDLRKLSVNGRVIEAPAHYTLLQACELAGEEIPRFCYHERLSIAGNCRMCLVEVVGSPKPVASCAQAVADLRPGRDGSPPAVNTNTPYVKKAREGVMEFLLINHPLDCPICDQGGECDLQDQALGYGRSYTRFEENKRAVEDKEMGPLVKTIMTRCIQCTRCVRFIAEVAGVEEIGMTGRGEDAEITTYLEAALTSELQGNIIDLCPVGALTSKPYAFNARPWELEKTETVDVMDALGSNIRVDSRGPAVMRILPRTNEEINEEWISDKTRFVWDGLSRQRLDRPYVRKRGKLTPVGWSEALDAAAKKLKGDPEKIAAIAGDLCDAESMKALLDLMKSLGVRSLDCRQDGAKLGGAGAPRESWLFNTTIYGVDEADALLLVGTNPRLEAPVLNARIRGAWLENSLEVGVIGEPADLTFPYAFLGGGPGTLKDLVDAGHSFTDVLKRARRPMLILGQGALARPDGAAVAHLAARLAQATGMFIAPSEESPEGWNGFNVLHTAAARVGGLDMGFVPASGGRDVAGVLEGARAGAVETVFLLGADELDVEPLEDAFVIYLGSHGDRGAQVADVILPGAAYTEKNATYVNTEGRVQLALRAVFPKGEAREDWAIIRALSDRVGRTLPYDDLEALREKLRRDHPTFGAVDYAPGGASAGAIDPSRIGAEGPVGKAAFESATKSFYFTNPIARASVTLARAAAAADAARAKLQAAE